MTMRAFLRFSFIYFIFAVLLVTLVRQDGIYAVAYTVMKSRSYIATYVDFLLPITALLGVFAAMIGPRAILARLPAALTAFIACLFFQAAFTLIKNTLPYLVPFYADPYLAKFDQVLHFGQDPWVWTHSVAHGVGASNLAYFYVSIWALPAMTLPVIMAATDGDTERTNRFLILYVIAWVVLGNLVALAGISAGPVFYDRLIGVDRFAELAPALAESGLQATMIGNWQNYLWDAYASNEGAVGTGISAFPSVHVAMATVTALYLGERNKYLNIIGVAFVGAILFISVWSGYHYAIDGYASLLIVGVAYFALRKAIRLPRWHITAQNNAMT